MTESERSKGRIGIRNWDKEKLNNQCELEVSSGSWTVEEVVEQQAHSTFY